MGDVALDEIYYVVGGFHLYIGLPYLIRFSHPCCPSPSPIYRLRGFDMVLAKRISTRASLLSCKPSDERKRPALYAMSSFIPSTNKDYS